MKEFSLPVSDCGCFVAGELRPDVFDVPAGEKPHPKYGVIIWYESVEASRAACIAATNAHWAD